MARPILPCVRVIVVNESIDVAGLGRTGAGALDELDACGGGLALAVSLLRVCPASGEGRVLGAFARALEGRVRRVSGGPEVTVGDGTVHVLLMLARPEALDPTCNAPSKIINRYVRPLLRGLGRLGRP